MLMFTLRSVSVLRILRKYPESLSWLDQTLWPLNVTPRTPDVSSKTEHNELEKGRQSRVLSPLLSYIPASKNSQYHAIANLVSLKTEQIIGLAKNTLVLVENNYISVLDILAYSANPKWHWSVEWYQAINWLKKFAQEQLTLARLQKL
jgi:hypothetical protein